MKFLRYMITTSALFIMPYASVNADGDLKCKCHQKWFQLKELKGTYAGLATTVGGVQFPAEGNTSVELARLKLKEDGTGVTTFFNTIASNSSGEVTYLESSVLPVQVINLNAEGVAKLVVHGWPLAGLDTYFDVIFRKDGGQVIGFSAIRVAVVQQPGSTTPIPLDYANAIINYKFITQFGKA